MVNKELRLRIGDKSYDIIKEYARKRGCSMAYVCRVAITSFLSRKGLYRG